MKRKRETNGDERESPSISYGSADVDSSSTSMYSAHRLYKCGQMNKTQKENVNRNFSLKTLPSANMDRSSSLLQKYSIKSKLNFMQVNSSSIERNLLGE